MDTDQLPGTPLPVDGKTAAPAIDRDHVTADALIVAPELLGLPLARPRQRAAAFALDWLLISVMASLADWLLAPVLALLAVALWLHPHSGVPQRGARIAAALMLLLALAFGWSELKPLITPPAPAAQSSPAQAPVNALPEAIEAITDAVTNPRRKPAREAVSEALSQPQQLAALQARNDALERENRALRERGSVLGDAFEKISDELGTATWAALYFTLFTALWQGCTPGKRLLGTRVLRLNGQAITLWESFGRYGGYAAGLATGLLGFAQIGWDGNRQAIHDKISATVVINTRASAR